MHIRTLAIGSAMVALLAASTGNAQTKPAAAHIFTGKYTLHPQQDDTTAEIAALGKGRYKVSVTWGGMTAGGSFNSDGWEGTGQAQGNVLTIRRPDGAPTCTLTFVPAAKPVYRMKGCGGGDGTYRRAPAKR